MLFQPIYGTQITPARNSFENMSSRLDRVVYIPLYPQHHAGKNCKQRSYFKLCIFEKRDSLI